MFRSAIDTPLGLLSVSLIVTASFPKPVIPLVFAYAVFTSEIVPVRVVIADPVTATDVLPARVFNAPAATEVSVIVTV